MNIVPDQGSLFSSKEMGLSVSEWDEIQEQVRERIFNRYTRSKAIWIPGNVPSLKNSKEIIQIYTSKSSCCKSDVYRSKRNGELMAFCKVCRKPQKLRRPIITSSKNVKAYQEATYETYVHYKDLWLDLVKDMHPPYLLGMYYVRDSKRIFDYGNASEIIQDTMTKVGYWEDDNMNICKPEHLGFMVDTKAPGVFIFPLPKLFMREVIKMI